jgi:hypothetical protein
VSEAKTVDAVRFVRKMAGRTQAHLLRASDGREYVVKFSNNPQGRRIPVNEWIVSHLLERSGILTQSAAVIRVTPEFLAENPAVHLGSRQAPWPVESGRHFGSLYPGAASSTSVFDFLPDSLLCRVANLAHFRAILVFDKWLGHTGRRQCIFYREKAASFGSCHAHPRWVASMIGHGSAFSGSLWDFPDLPRGGLYSRCLVYRNVKSLKDFQPWLDQVSSFPEALIEDAHEAVPPEYLEHDREHLERLLEHLCRQREDVPELLSEYCQSAPEAFPLWSPATLHSMPAQLEDLFHAEARQMRGFVFSSFRLVRRMPMTPRCTLVPMLGAVA